MSLKRTGQRSLRPDCVSCKSGRSKVRGHLSTLALVLFSLQQQQGKEEEEDKNKNANVINVERNNSIALNVSTIICHASTRLRFHGHGPKSNLVHYLQ